MDKIGVLVGLIGMILSSGLILYGDPTGTSSVVLLACFIQTYISYYKLEAGETL